MRLSNKRACRLFKSHEQLVADVAALRAAHPEYTECAARTTVFRREYAVRKHVLGRQVSSLCLAIAVDADMKGVCR